MTGASMRWVIDAVEPCAFGAPLRGFGAGPRRLPTARRNRSIKDQGWPSQARAVPVGSIPDEARTTALGNIAQ